MDHLLWRIGNVGVLASLFSCYVSRICYSKSFYPYLFYLLSFYFSSLFSVYTIFTFFYPIKSNIASKIVLLLFPFIFFSLFFDFFILFWVPAMQLLIPCNISVYSSLELQSIVSLTQVNNSSDVHFVTPFFIIYNVLTF